MPSPLKKIVCTQDTHSLVPCDFARLFYFLFKKFTTSILRGRFVTSCRKPRVRSSFFIGFLSFRFVFRPSLESSRNIILFTQTAFFRFSCFLFFYPFFRLDYQPLFEKMIKDRTRQTAEIEPTFFLCVLNYTFFIRLLPSSDYDDGMNSSWFT